MEFKKINNWTGWIVTLIACTVYVMTTEAASSFWDCGEFISSAYKLQIPHPPGAPMFVLLGRFFIILFGDNPFTAAKAVNTMSALASGFTIMFLFWTITHFAKRMVEKKSGEALNSFQIILVMGAGIVGALAYTFSDSFWYSAVEGEVYALSSFFTALVFWAMLKWEHNADKAGADKWIIFILHNGYFNRSPFVEYFNDSCNCNDLLFP
jgi:heme A synthase